MNSIEQKQYRNHVKNPIRNLFNLIQRIWTHLDDNNTVNEIFQTKYVD